MRFKITTAMPPKQPFQRNECNWKGLEPKKNDAVIVPVTIVRIIETKRKKAPNPFKIGPEEK
jgi:hypothetical protein